MAKKRSVLTTFVLALLIITAMLCLNPVHANAKTTTESTHTTGTVTATLLYVREEPTINSNIIGSVREGNQLTMEEVVKTSDKVYTNWLKINYFGKVGYVSQNYVDIQEEELENDVGVVTAYLVNVRKQPKISSNVIGTVNKGDLLTIDEVIETSDKNYTTWLKIKFNEQVGYISKNYVDYVDKKEEKPDTEFESYIGVITASGLNLRPKPTTSSAPITVLKKDSLVIVSDKVNTTWLKVKYNKTVGYVSQQYVDVYENEEETTKVGIVSQDLNLRTKPTTNSDVKEILSKGAYVDILDTRTTSDIYKQWYQVRSPRGNIGWVVGKYLEVD